MGHGSYRISGNFGPIIPSVTDAKNNGFDDCLWLLDDYLEELSIMNIFFYIQNRHGEKELITPSANGTIFNGSHRKAIIELADKIAFDKNVTVIERKISIHEIISAYEEDRVIEIFGVSNENLV